MITMLIKTAFPIALRARTERWVLARGDDTSTCLTSDSTGRTFNSDRADFTG
jgi:hypothetical protein